MSRSEASDSSKDGSIQVRLVKFKSKTRIHPINKFSSEKTEFLDGGLSQFR